MSQDNNDNINITFSENINNISNILVQKLLNLDIKSFFFKIIK